jgi:hypothetical protein
MSMSSLCNPQRRRVPFGWIELKNSTRLDDGLLIVNRFIHNIVNGFIHNILYSTPHPTDYIFFTSVVHSYSYISSKNSCCTCMLTHVLVWTSDIQGHIRRWVRQDIPAELWVLAWRELKKNYACYPSTSHGPMTGVLYVSTAKLAFCSDSPWHMSPKIIRPSPPSTRYMVSFLCLVIICNNKSFYLIFKQWIEGPELFSNTLPNFVFLWINNEIYAATWHFLDYCKNVNVLCLL